MFGIKKHGREKAERFRKAIKEQISPITVKMSEKIRLGPRVRLANMWAKKHPKRLMFYYSAFAVLLLGFTLLADIINPQEKGNDILGINSIPSMRHRLESLNNTELQNERIRREINELGQKGLEIYNEFDSLMKLPNKTHEDSVRIYRNYEILNNTFNSHGNKL